MENNTKNNNFYKIQKNEKTNFFVPFISSILGTSIVLSICFGIPSIKNKIIGNVDKNVSYESTKKQEREEEQKNNIVPISNISDTGVSVADKVLPSIVGIEVEFNISSSFMGSSTTKSEGSGVIISQDGYILTNNHIIAAQSDSFSQVSEANKVIIHLYNDKTAYEGKIIGADELTDLAVIKIEKTDLVAAELGDSDFIKVGEFAMAIGNPLGMKSSVTGGYISALNREVSDVSGKKYKLIQTDAAINSGNSGGALVNNKGQVIGINTLKLSGSGIEGMGFAIPINATKEIYSQLIEFKKVKRPHIGISGVDIDDKIAKKYDLPVGVYVKSIQDFSAAEKAELKTGDVIISGNGKEIKSMNDLNAIKDSLKIGDEINLKIIRDKKEIEIKIILLEQP